jgi:hypothetical protein
MYDDVKPPILNIKESIKYAKKEGRYEKCLMQIRKSTVDPVAAPNTIKGEFEIKSQYQ